jgi:hypothetical protein
VGVVLSRRALSIYVLPSHGIAGGVIDVNGARVGGQQATGTQNDPDLAWLGAAICICSAAVTCSGAYLLINILFF